MTNSKFAVAATGLLKAQDHLIKSDISSLLKKNRFNDIDPTIFGPIKTINNFLRQENYGYEKLAELGMDEACYKVVMESVTSNILKTVDKLLERSEYIPKNKRDLMSLLNEDHSLIIERSFVRSAINFEMIQVDSIINRSESTSEYSQDIPESIGLEINQILSLEEENREKLVSSIPAHIIQETVEELLNEDFYQSPSYMTDDNLIKITSDFVNLLTKKWGHKLSEQDKKEVKTYFLGSMTKAA